MDSSEVGSNPRGQVLFKVRCPALALDVVLFTQTWEEHILEGHPEMTGKEELVKRVVKECHSVADIYARDAKRIFIQRDCQDFKPSNHSLRVSLILKKKGYAIVTTTFPVNGLPKGVKRYESSQ